MEAEQFKKDLAEEYRQAGQLFFLDCCALSIIMIILH
jgi:hypothetical protein